MEPREQEASSKYDKHIHYGILLSKIQRLPFLESPTVSFPTAYKKRDSNQVPGTAWLIFSLARIGTTVGLNPELTLCMSVTCEV